MTFRIIGFAFLKPTKSTEQFDADSTEPNLYSTLETVLRIFFNFFSCRKLVEQTMNSALKSQDDRLRSLKCLFSHRWKLSRCDVPLIHHHNDEADKIYFSLRTADESYFNLSFFLLDQLSLSTLESIELNLTWIISNDPNFWRHFLNEIVEEIRENSFRRDSQSENVSSKSCSCFVRWFSVWQNYRIEMFYLFDEPKVGSKKLIP